MDRIPHYYYLFSYEVFLLRLLFLPSTVIAGLSRLAVVKHLVLPCYFVVRISVFLLLKCLFNFYEVSLLILRDQSTQLQQRPFFTFWISTVIFYLALFYQASFQRD